MSQLVTQVEQTRQAGELGGMRRAFLATGLSHAKDYGEAMRERLAPGIDRYCKKLLEQVDEGDRTAMITFPRIMAELGAGKDLLAAFASAIGAASIAHMKSAASAALDAEAVDDETAYAQALSFVNDYRKQRGLSPLLEPVEPTDEVP